MALYSNLRDYKFSSDADVSDIRGATVYGIDDEKLGKIDDVIFDQRTGDVRYVVVDSGGWLTSKKFVVPARQLFTREEADEDFHVSLTKRQVHELPEYREEEMQSEERWNNFESRYEAAWSDAPVIHREGSTHTVTPEAEEAPIEGSRTPLRSREQVEKAAPRRIAEDRPRFGATSDTEDSTGTGSLIADTTQREPIMTEYTGVDAVIPLQASEEPVTISRTEFTKQGTAKSEEETLGKTPLPAQTEKMDSGSVSVTGSRYEVGRRFREFQERLRRDREEILRRRQSRDRAA